MKLLTTSSQVLIIIFLPITISLLALCWICLKGLKPKEYKHFIDYWNSFIWHFFNARSKHGLELFTDMKDLVRG